MRYYLDTEFNGFGGELISLALVSDNSRELYLVAEEAMSDRFIWNEWVFENVYPHLSLSTAPADLAPLRMFGPWIAGFLEGDPDPVIIADWPDDIRYFCQCLITGPGQMAPIHRLRFIMERIDAYPTTLPGAIQHNALWDARALKHKHLEG